MRCKSVVWHFKDSLWFWYFLVNYEYFLNHPSAFFPARYSNFCVHRLHHLRVRKGQFSASYRDDVLGMWRMELKAHNFLALPVEKKTDVPSLCWDGPEGGGKQAVARANMRMKITADSRQGNSKYREWSNLEIIQASGSPPLARECQHQLLCLCGQTQGQ